MLKSLPKARNGTRSKRHVKNTASTHFSTNRRSLDLGFGLDAITSTDSTKNGPSTTQSNAKYAPTQDDFFSWGQSHDTPAAPGRDSRNASSRGGQGSRDNRNDRRPPPAAGNTNDKQSSFQFDTPSSKKQSKVKGKMSNPFDSGDEDIFGGKPLTPRSTPPKTPPPPPPSQLSQPRSKSIPSFDSTFDDRHSEGSLPSPIPKSSHPNAKLSTSTMTSSFTTTITPIGGANKRSSPIPTTASSANPYSVASFTDENDVSEDVDDFVLRTAQKKLNSNSGFNSDPNHVNNRAHGYQSQQSQHNRQQQQQQQQQRPRAFGNHQQGDRFGNIHRPGRERLFGDHGPRVSNFHVSDDEEMQTFKSKQQSLFEMNPNHAPQSQFKQLRDSKAKNKYITPNMPVPIAGEALYGTHAVYSAIVNQKRKLNQMYILASVYEAVKHAARPADFKDKDAFNNFTSGTQAQDDNLIDSSFMVDSSSSKIKSIITRFDDDSEVDTPLDNDGNARDKYTTPHHLESNREHLMMIYELANSIPGFSILSLRREKLDLLSGNRPHNGVVLDAQPIAPINKTKLDLDDFFITDSHVDDMKSTSVNLKPTTKEHTAALKREGRLAKQAQEQQEATQQDKKPAVYLAVESVFDPNNLGAILRSSTFFGVDSLILPHNSCPLSPVVAKVSSGALDSMPLIQCNNLSNFIAQSIDASHYKNDPTKQGKQSYIDRAAGNTSTNSLRKLTRNFDNLCVIGLGLTNDINSVSGSNIFNFLKDDLVPQLQNASVRGDIDPFSILLIAGNEGFGLSENIARKCHLMLQIPAEGKYPNTFNGISIRPVVDSLNVSNAVAIAVNDVMASRRAVM